MYSICFGVKASSNTRNMPSSFNDHISSSYGIMNQHIQEPSSMGPRPKSSNARDSKLFQIYHIIFQEDV